MVLKVNDSNLITNWQLNDKDSEPSSSPASSVPNQPVQQSDFTETLASKEFVEPRLRFLINNQIPQNPQAGNLVQLPVQVPDSKEQKVSTDQPSVNNASGSDQISTEQVAALKEKFSRVKTAEERAEKAWKSAVPDVADVTIFNAGPLFDAVKRSRMLKGFDIDRSGSSGSMKRPQKDFQMPNLPSVNDKTVNPTDRKGVLGDPKEKLSVIELSDPRLKVLEEMIRDSDQAAKRSFERDDPLRDPFKMLDPLRRREREMPPVETPSLKDMGLDVAVTKGLGGLSPRDLKKSAFDQWKDKGIGLSGKGNAKAVEAYFDHNKTSLQALESIVKGYNFQGAAHASLKLIEDWKKKDPTASFEVYALKKGTLAKELGKVASDLTLAEEEIAVVVKQKQPDGSIQRNLYIYDTNVKSNFRHFGNKGVSIEKWIVSAEIPSQQEKLEKSLATLRTELPLDTPLLSRDSNNLVGPPENKPDQKLVTTDKLLKPRAFTFSESLDLNIKTRVNVAGAEQVSGKTYQFIDDNYRAVTAPIFSRFAEFRGDAPRVLKDTDLRNEIGMAMNFRPDNRPTNPQEETLLENGNWNFYSKNHKQNETLQKIEKQITEVGGKQPKVTVLPIVLNTKEGGMIQLPLFRVKEVRNGRETGRDLFVDNQGRRYDSITHWKDTNKLPQGRIYYPENGKLETGADGSVKVTAANTPATVDTWWEEIAPWVDGIAIVGGVIAGGVILIGSGGTAAPIVAGAAGLWTAGRAGEELYDIYSHGESLSPFESRQARSAWLNLASSGISGLAALSQTVKVANLSQRGLTIMTWQQRLGVAAQYADTLAIANTGRDLWQNWDKMTPEDRMMAVGQMAFWGGMLGVTAKQAGGLRNLYGFGEANNFVQIMRARAEIETALKGELGKLAVENVPVKVTVLEGKDFYGRFASTSGDAVTTVNQGKNGVEVEVFFRKGGDPSKVREEAVHILQAADPSISPKLARLTEENLGNWKNLTDQQKLDLYKTKFEVEIDAQKRLLKLYENADPDFISSVQRNLRNLEAHLAEVGEVAKNPSTLKNRSWYNPEQAPRLFSKEWRGWQEAQKQKIPPDDPGYAEDGYRWVYKSGELYYERMDTNLPQRYFDKVEGKFKTLDTGVIAHKYLADADSFAWPSATAAKRTQLLKDRSSAQVERDKLQKLKEAAPERFSSTQEQELSKWRNQVVQKSRELGEMAGEQWVKATFGKDAKLLWGGSTKASTSGDFDQVWLVKGKDNKERFVVIEAKGGSSGLGTRNLADGTVAEQGTRSYFEEIAKLMIATEKSASKVKLKDADTVGGKLLKALRSKEVDYYEVRAPIAVQSGTPVAQNVKVRQFDISGK
ncbi:MAG: DUF4781 domain-containing protein [Blastocatellia bacterium]|nr:DUF4781 domain-containing protein [Blastocatellia bacterium]